MATEPGSQRPNWLHRIGYVCTAIVAVQLVVIAAELVTALFEQSIRDAKFREETRTHSRPLGATGPITLHLPKPKQLGADGARMFAEPSFYDAEYAVAIWGKDSNGGPKGVLVIRHRDADGVPLNRFSKSEFRIPRADYVAATARIDELADGYDGTAQICLDGTAFSFELKRAGKVMSGGGNTCFDHYHKVSAVFLDLAQRFGPPAVRDLDPNWMPKQP